MKHLDAVVSGVGNGDLPVKGNGGSLWRDELAGAVAIRADRTHQPSIDSNAPRIDQVDAVVFGVGDGELAATAKIERARAADLHYAGCVYPAGAVVIQLRSPDSEVVPIVVELQAIVARIGDGNVEV